MTGTMIESPRSHNRSNNKNVTREYEYTPEYEYTRLHFIQRLFTANIQDRHSYTYASNYT
jgi:hypothetical protein